MVWWDKFYQPSSVDDVWFVGRETLLMQKIYPCYERFPVRHGRSIHNDAPGHWATVRAGKSFTEVDGLTCEVQECIPGPSESSRWKVFYELKISAPHMRVLQGQIVTIDWCPAINKCNCFQVRQQQLLLRSYINFTLFLKSSMRNKLVSCFIFEPQKVVDFLK